MSGDQKYVIGIIVGSECNSAVEREFRKYVPEDVVIRTAMDKMKKVSYEGLMEFLDNLPAAADSLFSSQPDILVVPSMTGSCIRGNEIVNMLEQQCGLPVFVPAKGFVKALEMIGGSEIAVVSAFGVELGLIEKYFFKRNGINIAKVVSVSENLDGDSQAIDFIDSRVILEKVKMADFEDVDAVIFDSPTYDLEDIKEELKQHIGKPVLTVNQLLLYFTLKKLGKSVEHLDISVYLDGTHKGGRKR